MSAGLPNRNGRRSGPGTSSWWGVLRDMMQVGLGLRRWLLIGACGVAVCAVGMAFVLKNVFSLFVPNVLPWHLEGLIVGLLGIAMIVFGVYGLYRSLGPLVLRQQGVNSLTNTIITRRMRERGPKVVAIGGGTGLSMLLRGLKAYTDNITAIITVADDGGSSGRLRRELGLIPPGDFRNCLVALSEEEGVVADLFQYRFDQGGGLKGHSFGNLFIAAMTDVTGSFEQALFESSKVLAVRGRIVPATVAHLSLVAELDDGSLVKGESMITARGRQHREGDDRACGRRRPTRRRWRPSAQADLVVIGPGSLYTSLVPNLLVPEISRGDQDATSRAEGVRLQCGDREGRDGGGTPSPITCSPCNAIHSPGWSTWWWRTPVRFRIEPGPGSDACAAVRRASDRCERRHGGPG